jgi:Flp pilus assembly protein TadG
VAPYLLLLNPIYSLRLTSLYANQVSFQNLTRSNLAVNLSQWRANVEKIPPASRVIRVGRKKTMNVLRGKPRPSGKWLSCTSRGQTLVEFAFVAPILITLIVAIAVFGVAFDQYLALTFATNNAAQLLAISRGQTTDPCKTTSQAAYASAPQLTQANIKFSIVLGSNTVASNSANPSCSGSQQYLVQSNSAKVTATYPCNLQVFGINPAPNCTLSATTTVAIQ